MLRSTEHLRGYRLDATDGQIGGVKDVLFDDATWMVRYFVADTRRWLPGRKVLISPVAVGTPDWNRNLLPVNLTREQVRESPPIEEDPPVSRQRETELVGHFAWPAYWYPAGPAMGTMVSASLPQFRENLDNADAENGRVGDVHLRSAHGVTGYHLFAHEGEIGHVDDFIVSDEDWRIRYIVADTRNWLPGRKVLLSPIWFDAFDWEGQEAYVDLTRQQIKDSPPFDPSRPVNRDYEGRLFDYYGRPDYWEQADNLPMSLRI